MRFINCRFFRFVDVNFDEDFDAEIEIGVDLRIFVHKLVVSSACFISVLSFFSALVDDE